MRVTSHSEGTPSGTFRIVVGLIWHRLHLDDFWQVVAFVTGMLVGVGVADVIGVAILFVGLVR